MKNIPVAVPDEVYRRARLAAARQDTSVSALVAEILQEIASGRSRHTKRAATIAKAFDTIPAFRASDRLTRDPLNDRTVLRELQQRHQISYRDAAIPAAARKLAAATVLSDDLAHGQTYDGVTVLNPFLPGAELPA